jgi:zinc protease
MSPNNGVLAIYGDVKTADVKAAVEKAFDAWKSSGPAPALHSQPSTLNSLTRVTETRDKKQAVLVIGFPGTTLHSEERHALELLQEACSDLGSRLFLRVREKLGLAYYVGAQNFVGLSPGYFAFYAGTEPEKAALVETELMKEADLLRAEGLTQEELQRAKAKVIGQKKISRQDLGTFAMTTALDELYGLGYGYSDAEDAKLEAVSLEQVKAVAQKYLQSHTAVIATVKPEKS